MKSRGKVAQKYKQVQYRHIKREIGRLLRRSAPNCKNNRTLDLDMGPVGVCSLDCQVCDARFEDRAPDCEDWVPRHEKEAIKASLKEFFRTRKVPEIAVRFPDVAALLWVLADGDDDPQKGPLVPNDTPTTTLLGVQVWTDTPEEAEELKEAVESSLSVAKEARAAWDEALTEEQRLKGIVSAAHGEELRLRGVVSELEERLEEAEKGRRELLGEAVIQAAPAPWWRRWIPWG